MDTEHDSLLQRYNIVIQCGTVLRGETAAWTKGIRIKQIIFILANLRIVGTDVTSSELIFLT